MKKGILLSVLLFFTWASFTACSTEESSSTNSTQTGNTTTTQTQADVLQKAEFVLKEFHYPQSKDSDLAPFQVFSLQSKPSSDSILRDGRLLKVTLKDADKAVIPCNGQEAAEDCSNGVRSFVKADLVQEGFTISTNAAYVEYLQMEIYNSSDVLLYKTDRDIPINNDKGETLERSFNFYPNQAITMSTNQLKKTIQFSLPLSDVSNEVVGYATSGNVTGELTCAQENGSAYEGFPLNLSFTHNSGNKKIDSDSPELNHLYVGSPCELTVTGTKGGDTIFEGKVKFDVEDDKEQSVNQPLYLDTIGQTLVTTFVSDATGDLQITVNNSALDASIKDYFNRNVPLKYKIRIKNNSFDQTITLSTNDGGNTLTGEISFPHGEEVEVTFSAFKDNESTSWAGHTQNATFTTGAQTLPAFTLQLDKKVNFNTTRTMGKASIRVLSESTKEPIEGVSVTFRGSNSAEDITEITDANGIASRMKLGKGLVHGVYTVDFIKEGLFFKQASFELEEYGVVNKTIEMEEGNHFSSSNILQSTEGYQLNLWVGNSNQNWERCYQRSQGASLAGMHSLCNNKGATIVLFKLDNGLRIGGYASHSWGTATSGYFGDSSSFLFSLTNNHKHSYYQNTNYLHSNGGNRIAWGSGHDFYINGDVTNGATDLGTTYSCRVGSKGTNECRNDFAGGSSFTIVNMEVFYKTTVNDSTP